MPLDPARLRATPIPEVEHRYDGRDCVLYALGVGVGLDPMDEDELAYVDETRLRVQPTMANVLGYPGFWMRDPAFGLDWRRTVHGEHAVRLHRPLPTAGHVRGTSRILRDGKAIWEKPFLSGEANMSHSIANLEHHHFKYRLFRRPGDVHVHFFGTATLSFSEGVKTQAGDVFEIEAAPFRLAVRNPIAIAEEDRPVVKAL